MPGPQLIVDHAILEMLPTCAAAVTHRASYIHGAMITALIALLGVSAILSACILTGGAR